MTTIRPARPEDLTGVVAVMNAVDVVTLGEPDTTEEDIASGWEESTFDLGRDAIVVEHDGAIIGYGEVYARGEGGVHDVDVYADPLMPPLLDDVFAAVMQRAEQVGTGAVLSTWLGPDDPRRPLYERYGFSASRSFVRMRRDLTEPVEPADDPGGIRLASARRGMDEQAVHQVLADAFAHHARPLTTSFERFAEQHVDHPEYDPDLWGVAWHDDVAVGAMTLFDHGDLAFLRHVGVVRDYRGRGIASALIRRGMRQLQERGQTVLDLGVDVDDEVNAAAVYERLGFRVLQRLELVERRL